MSGGQSYLNPNQLRMFMSANEIEAEGWRPLHGDRQIRPEVHEIDDPDLPGMGFTIGEQRRETDEQLWDRKLDEAWDSGLRHSIADKGVQTPVHLAHEESDRGDNHPRQVVGGHHRLAVMRDEAPDDLMPVLHHRDLWDARGLDDQGQPYTFRNGKQGMGMGTPSYKYT